MPIWIKATDRFPPDFLGVCVRVKGKDLDAGHFYSGTRWWTFPNWSSNCHEQIEWLDETTPSFTQDQIINAYNDGWERGYDKNFDSAGDYLRKQYNIII